MRTNIFISLLVFIFAQNAISQSNPFQIAIEPMTIPDLGGVQAYAFAQYDGKWLIVGGRLDGLHQRQPWASFDEAGHNNQLLVIDPVAQKKWTAPLQTLPTSIQEQLSSTNMEFFQEGDYLYLVGGYGYSATVSDHVTYPYLTAIKVSVVVDAILNGSSFESAFRQINDDQFAVTGGYLNKIYDTFYLTGGQRFDGRYNPMNHPTFTQTYTNAIRKFTISDDGTNLSVNHLPAITDATNLHRRDYNVVPQIMPDGTEGITAFSGVFQLNVDLPYLNCVNIDSAGYSVNSEFSQYYNHYHCAHLPLYSAAKKEMHTIFFGGIAQYYDSLGILVQDDNVPFVKTIARVTRDANGQMAEYKLPVEMPALLGASSEFIPLSHLPQYPNNVLKLDEFSADSTLVGYIYGGISSTEANIFWINDGSQSSANHQLFKVYIVKNISTSTNHLLNPQSTGTLQLQVYPNPNQGRFSLNFNLQKTADVKLNIYNADGELLQGIRLEKMAAGENSYQSTIPNLNKGGVYLISIETSYEKATQKIIVEPSME